MFFLTDRIEDFRLTTSIRSKKLLHLVINYYCNNEILCGASSRFL